ncbi:MAG: fused MFS/spermidine synthase [Atopobiaceae bacterium]|nr:fused MFS/spermidine synthase [Atopobiaceae bacterium]
MGSDLVVTFAWLTVAGAVVAVVIRLLLPRVLAWRGVWFSWHTRFGPAMVFDSADADGTTVRLLNVNGTYQSVCYVDDDLLWDPVCEYHRSWAQVVHRTWPLRGWARAEGVVRRCLVMGGGGYSFPKWLVAYRPDFACVAVEIDPAIVRIARERLFVDKLEKDFEVRDTGRLELPVADAWAFLQEDEQGFDLIVNDAFRGNRPLGPMQTDEGARVVRAHLRVGGVYIGNVRSALEGRGAHVLKEAREAFEREFDHVKIIPERPEEPRKKGNNALVAWNDGAGGKD